MNSKKILKLSCLILILTFFCSYIIEMSGYYEYNLQSNKKLTEEQIKIFENDIKSGKEIDLNTYLKNTNIDYSNKLTRTTTEASIKINDYLKIFLNNSLNLISELVK